jgi:hypothetical protein
MKAGKVSGCGIHFWFSMVTTKQIKIVVTQMLSFTAFSFPTLKKAMREFSVKLVCGGQIKKCLTTIEHIGLKLNYCMQISYI